MLNGGGEIVDDGGQTIGTVVKAGGEEVLGGAGSRNIADATVISSGGQLLVGQGGTASGASILAGGQEQVLSGGVDQASVVHSGGVESILSGGTLSGGSVFGGTISVGAGATVAGGLTISGGSAIISGSLATGQTAAFAGTGGDLALDNLGGFAAVISGFVKGDKIDLGGFAFSTAAKASFTEAASLTSGTLTVLAGSQRAQLTLLGNYTTSNFALSNDGAGGIFIKHN